MRDVAVVAFAQSKHERRIEGFNEIEMMMPVVGELWDRTGLSANTVGFTCSGSTDFLAGQAFSFVTILDAIGPWPPISESHVEADGAWALYEAWVKLQMGEIDSALIYSYGKSSPGDLPKVLTTQLEPYSVAPLWPDSVSIAGLQARALLDSGKATEADLAEVAVRNRGNAKANPKAQLAGDYTVEQILAEPYLANPLRKHDCTPITDGAAAMIIAAGDLARELCERPAWIRGIDHRVEAHALGVRDLTDSPSTRLAGQKAGVGDAQGRPRRAARSVHPPGADRGRGPRAGRRRRHQPLGWAPGGQPDHGRRPDPHRRSRRAHHRRRRGPGRGPRHLRPLPATEPRVRPGR